MTEPSRPTKRVLRFVVSSALVSPLVLGAGCEPDRRTTNPAPVGTPPGDPAAERQPVSKSPAWPTPKKTTKPDRIVNTVQTLPVKPKPPEPQPPKTPQPKPSKTSPRDPILTNPGPTERLPVKPKPKETE